MVRSMSLLLNSQIDNHRLSIRHFGRANPCDHFYPVLKNRSKIAKFRNEISNEPTDKIFSKRKFCFKKLEQS